MVAIGDIILYSDDTVDYGSGPTLTQLPGIVVRIIDEQNGIICARVFYADGIFYIENIPNAVSFTSGYWTAKP